MSGVWTEQSIPMTDHECAIEALEEIQATILSQNPNHIRLRIDGREWSMEKRRARFSVRYNQRNTSSSQLSWMNSLASVYERAVERKRIRLQTEEEKASLAEEKEAIQRERLAFEQQRQNLIEERKSEIRTKAEALGYRVKEREENGQVRLVLVRQA